MSDSNMPVTEAGSVNDREPVAYELAYHVLPTVAEGEVAAVTAELKDIITQAGGQIFDEEIAERFELAYDIEKYLEGRYRHFSSAYFGWLRFRLDPASLVGVTDELSAHKSLLRHLMIRLSKTEEANPFRFHESLVDIKSRQQRVEDNDGEIVEDGGTEEVEEVVVEVETDSDDSSEEVLK